MASYIFCIPQIKHLNKDRYINRFDFFNVKKSKRN